MLHIIGGLEKSPKSFLTTFQEMPKTEQFVTNASF